MKTLRVELNKDNIVIQSNEDFICCKRKSDGKLGLYDVKEKKFIEVKEEPQDEKVEAIPVELKEVIDDPQEDVREYFTKAMLDNRIYLHVKESKPKWYEIKKDQMVRLDAIQSIEKQCEWQECRYYIRLYAVGNNLIDIRCSNEEEATAKYNELKALLEEV